MYPKGISHFYTSRNMMKFWSNFAKYGKPGYSTNNIEWDIYTYDEKKFSSFIILDKKKNLKMSSDNVTFEKLAKEIYVDERLNKIEKCVVLYQMFTYVGHDIYNEKIKNYPDKCDRKTSENFIINNASVIDYD